MFCFIRLFFKSCHHFVTRVTTRKIKGGKTMNTIEKSTNWSILLDKGIILQSGAICKDKINLISWAMTAPLIETIWTFSGYNVEAINRLTGILNQLYRAGKRCEMLDIL